MAFGRRSVACSQAHHDVFLAHCRRLGKSGEGQLEEWIEEHCGPMPAGETRAEHRARPRVRTPPAPPPPPPPSLPGWCGARYAAPASGLIECDLPPGHLALQHHSGAHPRLGRIQWTQDGALLVPPRHVAPPRCPCCSTGVRLAGDRCIRCMDCQPGPEGWRPVAPCRRAPLPPAPDLPRHQPGDRERATVPPQQLLL